MKVKIQYMETDSLTKDTRTIVLHEVESNLVNISLRNNPDIGTIYLYPDEQVVVLHTLPDRIDEEIRGNNIVFIHIIGDLEGSIWRDKPIQLYQDSISRTVMQKGEEVKV